MKYLYTIATLIMALVINTSSVIAQGNSFGYPLPPETSSASTDPVGSPAGSFAVSPLGAATYTVPIEVPQGLPGATPQIAITYNSQGGNGIAGYGCSISGVSTITRVPRDIYHDGAAAGIDYTADDAFSLDGRRLILTQPAANSDSAVYCLEDSPHTRIVIHNISSTMGNTWFSMTDTEGMKYEFRTRQQCYQDGQIWVKTWYLDKAVTPIGNSIDLIYSNDGYSKYLSQVSYGYSSTNRIVFSYEARPDTIFFSLKGNQGWTGKRLKSVTSATFANGSWNTYRHYVLSYDNTSDQSTTKYSRLTSVTVANGDDEELRPIEMEWEPLSAYSCEKEVPDFYPSIYNYGARAEDMSFFAADLNGDGLTDLVEMATEYVANQAQGSFLNVYYAYKGNDGSVGFSQNRHVVLPQTANMGDSWKNQYFSPTATDLDGDGINELLVPTFRVTVDSRYFGYRIYREGFYGPGEPEGVKYHDLHTNDPDNILWSVADFDNDGKYEAVVLEKEKEGTSSYYGAVIGGSTQTDAFCVLSRFTLPKEPKHIFTADMNCDGLTDVVIFYQNGYTVFWNDGNWLTNRYATNPPTLIPTYNNYSNSLNLAQAWMGDFNGDGIADFLVSAYNDSNLYFELGRGDGSVSHSIAATTEIHDHSLTEADDDKFSCHVLDLDGDGKSDAVINKAMYRYGGVLNIFQKNHTYWMRSNGSSLVLQSHATSNRMTDGRNRYYVSGDFDGNGMAEVASLSYDCYSGTDANEDPVFRIYKSQNFQHASGRMTTVTDGIGNETQISYKPLTDTTVYIKNKGGASTYPVQTLSLPLSVVSEQTMDNGSAGSQTKRYTYGGLKVHTCGKGLMGLSYTKVADLATEETVEEEITEWHSACFSPIHAVETRTIGGAVDTTYTNTWMTAYNISPIYYTSRMEVRLRDYNGNWTVDDCNYSSRYMTNHHHWSTDGWDKMTFYDYAAIGERRLPSSIYSTVQRDTFSIQVLQDAYQYDSRGQVIAETHNDSTATAVTTTYTYDSYGNMLSATIQDVANVLEPVTKTYQYDPTHRFVTRSVERGYIEHEYTYDIWGNILTDTDKTRPGYPLTTSYNYDGWGNVISTTSPEGLLTTRTMGWGNSLAKRYYVLEQGNARPWVKKWYDSQGREVLTESVAQGDILLQTTSTYNNKGLLTQRKDIRSCTATTLTVTEDFTYDSRGRKLSDVLSTGESTTYSYGNLTVTSTSAGRTWTTRYDMQDNVVETTDPLGTVTSYHYHACGKPLSVSSCGSTVTMEYDDAGRQTALHDPDAGTMSYAYDAYGRVTLQTDARNYKTASTYDDKGRLASTQTYLVNPTNNGYYTTEYTYGQSASDRGLLLSVSKNSGQTLLPPVSISYAYDALGRVSSEQHTYGVSPQKTWTFQYAYNSAGQLSSTTYPSGLQASYAYDAYGNLSSTSAAGQPLEQVQSVTPTQRVTQLGTGLTYSKSYNNRGQLTNAIMRRTSDSYVPAVMSFTYDNATAHLTSRSLMIMGTEYFTYDALDRLTGVRFGGSGEEKTFAYAPNGNLIYQTGLGHYYYESTKPHAVTAVDNLDASIPTALLTTSYNDIGKIDNIYDEGTAYTMSFNYGVDNERIQSKLSRNDTTIRTTYYLGDFEEVEENGGTRYFHYLGNDVLYIKQENGTGQPYYLFTDHLGSITCIVDQQGNAVFRASYDAWGRQTVTLNTIGFRRGYTGHEMMPEFGLINMNGRLYDPLIGRFLSTDNYVQEPWNSQNFNRYSYCLNNPLMYTDPSGDFFWLPVLIGAVINLAIEANNGNIHNFWDGFKAAAIGGAAGAVASATGGAIFTSLGGTATGGGGFLAGFGSGVMGSAASLPIQDIGNHIAFGDPHMSAQEYAMNVFFSGVMGGAINGATAQKYGNNFWTGNRPKSVPTASIADIKPVKIAEGEKTKLKTPQGLLSYEKGKLGTERAIRDFVENGGEFIQNEVTVEVDGIRNRFDFVGRKDEVLYFFEIKNGPYARPTRNQLLNIPRLCKPDASFIPIGKNAAKIRELELFELTRTPFKGNFIIVYTHYW